MEKSAEGHTRMALIYTLAKTAQSGQLIYLKGIKDTTYENMLNPFLKRRVLMFTRSMPGEFKFK